MITMLRSVEGRASCTDERYLFNSVESLGPAERDVNNICLRERAERVLRRALLVNIFCIYKSIDDL